MPTIQADFSNIVKDIFVDIKNVIITKINNALTYAQEISVLFADRDRAGHSGIYSPDGLKNKHNIFVNSFNQYKN